MLTVYRLVAHCRVFIKCILLYTDPTFVISPVSVNASLSDKVIEFFCACMYCNKQYWILDGQRAINEAHHGRGIGLEIRKRFANGTTLDRISLPPLEVNNNTEISCVIRNVTSNISVTSPMVVLRVQGENYTIK